MEDMTYQSHKTNMEQEEKGKLKQATR